MSKNDKQKQKRKQINREKKLREKTNAKKEKKKKYGISRGHVVVGNVSLKS